MSDNHQVNEMVRTLREPIRRTADGLFMPSQNGYRPSLWARIADAFYIFPMVFLRHSFGVRAVTLQKIGMGFLVLNLFDWFLEILTGLPITSSKQGIYLFVGVALYRWLMIQWRERQGNYVHSYFPGKSYRFLYWITRHRLSTKYIQLYVEPAFGVLVGLFSGRILGGPVMALAFIWGVFMLQKMTSRMYQQERDLELDQRDAALAAERAASNSYTNTRTADPASAAEHRDAMVRD